jgi:hypothetical protein
MLAEALVGLTELYQPLPELPMEAGCVLETLDRIGSPATTGMAGPRYFGFVIGGSLPAANWRVSGSHSESFVFSVALWTRALRQ